MIKRLAAVAAILSALLVFCPTPSSTACGLPPRPTFRAPCDSHSDRLFAIDRFFPDAKQEWRVFWYRLDNKEYSVYALPENCIFNPTLPPHTLVALRYMQSPDICIMYNDQGVEYWFKR